MMKRKEAKMKMKEKKMRRNDFGDGLSLIDPFWIGDQQRGKREDDRGERMKIKREG